MEPLGDYTEQQFYDNAAEQARMLADNGVDLIIIETMTDVRETAIAVRAAKQASGLPVIASISFDPVGDSFRTMMGDTSEKAVRELTEAGADVIGSNCGTIDPFEMSRLIAEMRSHSQGILSAMPNAGKPELSAGEVSFRLSPEEFAEGVRKCIKAGATLVGGCCGTTPSHIRAIAKESSLA
jgi:5-methyltetrahydrofolate--homocysteine methyltransferase